MEQDQQPHDMSHMAHDSGGFGNDHGDPGVQGADQDSGWVLRVEPVHHCILPNIDNRIFVGSIWQCGGCKQHWVVYEKRGKNAGTKAFKRIGPESVGERLENERQKHARATAK